MIYPQFLNKNDYIGVPAPSDGSDCEQSNNRIKNAKKNLENLGYRVKLSENIYNSNLGRSSNAVSRANEFNEMFEEKEMKLLLCASGGDFMVEILPYINFESLMENPKWVEGFSDPTSILFPITTKYDIATIYGNNFKSFGMQDYHISLKDNLKILEGDIINQENYELYENIRAERITGLEGYNLTDKVCWKVLQNEDINVKGRIIAGCLDIISELAGTKYDGMKEFNEKYKNDGIIICLDNCELSKEELIRTLWKLNEMEYFKYAKAIIFGRNGIETSCYGYDMENCLKDSVISKLNIPIIYDADISHKGPSMTIINGAISNINVSKGKANIIFELK